MITPMLTRLSYLLTATLLGISLWIGFSSPALAEYEPGSYGADTYSSCDYSEGCPAAPADNRSRDLLILGAFGTAGLLGLYLLSRFRRIRSQQRKAAPGAAATTTPRPPVQPTPPPESLES